MDIALAPFNIGALLGLGLFVAAAVYTVKDARNRQTAEVQRDSAGVEARPAFDYASRIELLVKFGVTIPSIGLSVAIMMGR